MDCSSIRFSVHGILQENWRGLLFPSPGDLPALTTLWSSVKIGYAQGNKALNLNDLFFIPRSWSSWTNFVLVCCYEIASLLANDEHTSEEFSTLKEPAAKTKKKVWEPVHRCRLFAQLMLCLSSLFTEPKVSLNPKAMPTSGVPSICYSSQASQWPAPEPGTIIVSQSWLTSCDATC